MTRLFRSKSCGLVGRSEFNPALASPFFHNVCKMNYEEEDEENEEDEQELDSDDDDDDSSNPVSTPFINPGGEVDNQARRGHGCQSHSQHQVAIMDILVAALRKSLVTCSAEREVVSSLDISRPTEVRHVSHVTFDRFNGFLGLPSELEPEVPRRVPSAR